MTVLSTGQERANSILNNTTGMINITKGNNLDPKWHEGFAITWIGQGQVTRFNNVIDEQSIQYGVDADWVKSIMYLETSQGLMRDIGGALLLQDLDTVLPMNINPSLWGGIGGITAEQIATSAEGNIAAGVVLIKEITNRLPSEQRTLENVASLWNNLNNTQSTDFGARAQNILDNRFWEETPSGYEYRTLSDEFFNEYGENFVIQTQETVDSFLGKLEHGFSEIFSGLVNTVGNVVETIHSFLPDLDIIDAVKYEGEKQKILIDENGASHIYKKYNHNFEDLKSSFGIGDDIQVVDNGDGTYTTIINYELETMFDNKTYSFTEIADNQVRAAEQLANFVTDQVEKATDWFTDTQGLQQDFSNWFSLNAGDLLNGNLDPDEAFVDFAKYTVSNRLGAYAIDIIGVNDATNAVGAVLVDIGLSADEAALISNSISQSFQRLAVAYVGNGFDLSGDQARDIAIGAVASTVANHYASQVFGEGTVNASAATSALTTLVIGISNSGGYNTQDWINLGLQVGIAYASASIGASVSASLSSIGAVAGSIGAIAGAIAGYVLGNILGGLLGGKKHFGPGEYPSYEAAIASQYVVGTTTDENGDTVPALFATNSEGSTLIATGIRHIIGGGGADVAVGNELDNVINGNGGDDYLEGRDGFDALFGGDGNDHLVANGGDDIINTGDGDNIAFGGGGNDTIISEDGDDQVFGDDGDDLIASQGGDDQVFGGLGNDILASGDGHDIIFAGEGDDSVDAGEGNDLLFGGLGSDVLNGEGGHDQIFGGLGNDQLFGGSGNDIISGGEGTNILEAGSGDDLLFAKDSDDFLDGSLGNDRIYGGNGNNHILGGFGNDLILAGVGNDIVEAGEGDDIVISNGGNDNITLGNGDDIILSTDSTKTISGGDGIDYFILDNVVSSGVVFAQDGNDLLLSHADNIIRISNNDIEKIEFSDGIVDLTAMTFNDTGYAHFSVETDVIKLSPVINSRANDLHSNISTEEDKESKYSLIDRISNESYAEEIRVDSENKFYNGPEINSFTRKAKSLFGSSKYKVYVLKWNDNIQGDNTGSVLASIESDTDTSEFDYIYNNAEMVESRFHQQIDNGPTGHLTTIYKDLWVDGEAVYSFVEVYQRQNYGHDEPLLIRSEQIDSTALEEVMDPDQLPHPVDMNATIRERYKYASENVSIGEKILTTGSDLIVGAAIDEEIFGNSGSDVLHGAAGNDTISGGSDDDWLYGGSGSDEMYGGQGDDVLNGEAENDILNGGDGNDIIYGSLGDDIFFDGKGNDIAYGGKGEDTFNIEQGENILNGGDGSDTYIFSSNSSLNIIEEADDAESIDIILWSGVPIFSRQGDNLIIGDPENLSQPSVIIRGQYDLSTGSKIEQIQISDGSFVTLPNEDLNNYNYIGGVQFYEVNPSDRTPKDIALQNQNISDISSIKRYAEDIHITFDNDNKLILLDHQSNPFIASLSDASGDVFNAFNYDQWLFVDSTHHYNNPQNDYIRGSAENSTLIGRDGSDYIDGAGGDDTIYGGEKSDIIYGGEGNDRLYGDYSTNIGNGNDRIYGGEGNDRLYGGNGNDYLDGGNGDDQFYGGGGQDTFVINREVNGLDYILDYEGQTGEDIIDLSDFSDLEITFEQLKSDFTYDGAYLVINLPDSQKIRLYSSDNYNSLTEDHFLGLKINHAPNAENDHFAGDENSSISGNVIDDNGFGNDFDTDVDDILIVSSGTFSTNNGTIILQENGDFTYTPNQDFVGEDSFEYTLNDNGGKSDTGTVTFNVQEFSLAENDFVLSSEDTAVSIQAILNDNVSNITSISFEQAALGVVSFADNQTFTYVPNINANGQDSFDYILIDDQGIDHRATVFINILPVNDAPIAQQDNFTLLENNVLNENVLADNSYGQDTDIEGDTLFVTPNDFTTSFGGGVSLLSNGDFSYTPALNYIGVDTFSYNITDGNGGSAAGTVRIAVEPLIEDIHGTGANDVLSGYNHTNLGDDKIFGYDGDDQIIANGGNDVIDGGVGDDIIHGGLGADTYIINTNSGNDTIVESDDDSIDVIKWNHPYINNFQKQGDDLIIGYPDNDNAPSVTVLNYFDNSGNYGIEKLEMADGLYRMLPSRVVNDFDYSGGIQFYDATNESIENNISVNSFEISDISHVYKSPTGDLKITFNAENYIFIKNLNEYPNFIKSLTDTEGEIFEGIDFDRWSMNVSGNSNGYSLRDYIIGSDDNNANSFFGGDGDDYLDGQGGNDTIYGQSDDDVILGGDGDDKLYGDSISETASDGDDTLNGGNGDDVIYGRGGDDVIIDGLGNDVLYGGSGRDRYYITREAGAIDQIVLELGVNSDIIDLSEFSNDNLTFSDLQAGAISNGLTLTLLLPDNQKIILYSPTGYESLVESNFIGLNTSPIAVADDMSVNIATTLSGNIFLDNGNGIDYDLDGDVITAQVQNITTVNGGLFVLQSNGDFTYTSGDNFIGTDSISYTILDTYNQTATATINVTVNAPIGSIVGSVNVDTLDGDDNNNVIFALSGNDRLYGQYGDDVLHGGDGDDYINGGGDNDLIYGGDGDDTRGLKGGSGEDVIYGGDGDDRIDGGKDDDVLYGEAGNDTIYGNEGNDTIDGGNGADTIKGKGGHDIINAGAGDDIYVYGEEGNDIIHGNEGHDLIRSGEGQDMLHGDEGNDKLYGQEDNDVIHGGLGNDIIYGGNSSSSDSYASDDELHGDEGDDKLYGGLGDDILDGGEGNDTLRGDVGNDVYILSKGQDDLYDKDGGADVLRFTATQNLENVAFSVSASDSRDLDVTVAGETLSTVIQNQNNSGSSRHLEYLELNDGFRLNFAQYEYWITGLSPTGTNGDDVLVSYAGDDVVNAGDGHDELIGGSGHDTLNGEDGHDRLHGGVGDDVLNGGAGDDCYFYTSGVDTITDVSGSDVIEFANDITLEDLSLSISVSDLEITVSGNSTNRIVVTGNTIESLRFASGLVVDVSNVASWIISEVGNVQIRGDNGGDQSDILFDAQGSNILKGYDLADTLYGLDGDDDIWGGTGADTIYGGSGDDYVRGDNSTDIVGGNDIIHGGAGDDDLRGYAGDDTLYGDEGNDTVRGGLGDDVIYGGIGDDIRLIGDEGKDTIYGDGGDDRLEGGAGTDTLYGGFGNDSLYGGSDNDVLYGNSGDDYLKGDDGDDVLYGQTGDDDLRGSVGNDTIYGGSGVDTLRGEEGNDTIYGGSDVDYYYGGDGVDTFVFTSDIIDDNDEITSLDRITDWDINGDNDILKLDNVFDSSYVEGTSDLNDYMQSLNENSNSIIQIDRDGSGSTYGWEDVVRVDGVNNLDIDILKANGQVEIV